MSIFGRSLKGSPRPCDWPDCDVAVGVYDDPVGGWKTNDEAHRLDSDNVLYYLCSDHATFIARHRDALVALLDVG